MYIYFVCLHSKRKTDKWLFLYEFSLCLFHVSIDSKRLLFGFYGPSRLFHSFRAELIVRLGKNERSPRNTTLPLACLTCDPSRARTHSGEKRLFTQLQTKAMLFCLFTNIEQPSTRVIQELMTMNPYIRKYLQNLNDLLQKNVYICVAYSCLKYGVFITTRSDAMRIFIQHYDENLYFDRFSFGHMLVHG